MPRPLSPEIEQQNRRIRELMVADEPRRSRRVARLPGQGARGGEAPPGRDDADANAPVASPVAEATEEDDGRAARARDDRAAGLTTIRLKPIPTGVYHLLDPETDPLLTVAVKNESHEPRRVCVAAHRGALGPGRQDHRAGPHGQVGQTVKLLPSLIPEQARRITEVQRHAPCTSRSSVDLRQRHLDKKVESQDTYSLVLLSRNSSFNSVVDPETGRPRDLTKYYAAWVTPHVEPVQALVRKAAEKVPGRRIWGYQGKMEPGGDRNPGQGPVRRPSRRRGSPTSTRSSTSAPGPARSPSGPGCRASRSATAAPTASTVRCSSPACWSPPRCTRRSCWFPATPSSAGRHGEAPTSGTTSKRP